MTTVERHSLLVISLALPGRVQSVVQSVSSHRVVGVNSVGTVAGQAAKSVMTQIPVPMMDVRLTVE